MYDRISNDPHSERCRQKIKLAAFVTTFVVMLTASVATAIHSYSTITRYMKHEVQQDTTTVRNDSLMLPVGKT